MKKYFFSLAMLLVAAFGFNSCTDDTSDLEAQINSLEQKLDSLSSKDLQKEIDDLRTELAGKYSEKEVEAKVSELLNDFGISGVENGHFYVDLGLPSGTLWATCNVGANFPEEYGQYFAWGETKGYYKYEKHSFDWTNYFDAPNNDDKTFTTYQYQEGGITELKPEHDAATQNWGGKWRMPSKADIDELMNTDNCTCTWIDKKGCYIKSNKNNNSIFLPAAGYRSDSDIAEEDYGFYWVQSLHMKNNNKYASFCAVKIKQKSYYDRCRGLSIRPVCSPAK